MGVFPLGVEKERGIGFGEGERNKTDLLGGEKEGGFTGR